MRWTPLNTRYATEAPLTGKAVGLSLLSRSVQAFGRGTFGVPLARPSLSFQRFLTALSTNKSS